MNDCGETMDTKESDIKTKLKRLKLEEQRIIGVKYVNCQNHFKIQDEIDIGLFYHQCKEFNMLRENLKQSFNQITLLYDDVQNNTNKKECLEELDIDDLKKEVYELLQKIKTQKMFIKSELTSRINEQHIIEEGLINSTAEDKIKCYEQRPKTKLFKEIVPSPVRAIILSPFKSKEVQQYQDFLYNSPNRYGGWNEYNHNIFVQCWNRYINNKNFELVIDQLDEHINNMNSSSVFKIFMDEIAQKISGISVENVICHCKWYAKYLFFYNQQQKALENWKEHKAKIKQTHSNGKKRKDAQRFISNFYYDGDHKVSVNKDIYCYEETKTLSNNDKFRKRLIDKETKEEVLIRLSKPLNNQNYERNSMKQNLHNFDLENIPKLCTPNWRLNFFKRQV